MQTYEQCKDWFRAHSDLFVDLVRIYLGVGLFFKGCYFASHRMEVMGLMEGVDNFWFAPAAVLHYIIPAHLVGGALLAVGLLTRFGALIQIPVLFGAVIYIYMPQVMAFELRQSLEFSALVLYLLILILFFGGGRLSLDGYLRRKTSEETVAQAAA